MIEGKLKNIVLVCLTGLFLLMGACSDDDVIVRTEPPQSIDLNTSFYYEVDLNNSADDKFRVSLFTTNLTAGNAIFQLPATVPGTYSILDFGRFVTDIKAYDENYNLLEVSRVDIDQWQVSSPEDVYRIDYEIYETWDTPVNENQIFWMAGTSIEDRHVLLNTFGVLGYLTGLKERDFYLKIYYPGQWKVATSLQRTSDGYYWAQDYDHLADSPILLGELSDASLTIDNADINIYTYSELGIISSADMANDLGQVITDASAFLEVLPIDRYNFLYLFEGTRSYGALEHSLSSVYVMADISYNDYGDLLKSFAAHEFFHVVIPLNIHSEIIEDFNFAVPTPSEHLWLYEGVTEWASDLMQYRNGSMDIDELFVQFQGKIYNDQTYYDPNYSLSQISLNSYTQEGGSQYGNIYNRGSMVAALLDIKLLQLSNGEMGLRELILQLMDTYGPDNAFQDDQFFAVIVDMTYPEIEQFVNDYIRGTEALPYQEYFDLIGIDYDPANLEFGLNPEMTESQNFLFERWKVNF